MVTSMDIGSKEDGAKLPDADDISPEERLQRLVLASLRDEYDPPVIDATVERPVASQHPVTSDGPEISEPATRGWRRLDLFLALVIAGAAAGALLLLAIGRYDLDHDASVPSTAATAPVHPTSQSAQISQSPSPPEQAPAPREVALAAGASTVQPNNPPPAAPTSTTPAQSASVTDAPAAAVPGPVPGAPAAPVSAAAAPAATVPAATVPAASVPTPVPAAPIPAPQPTRSLAPPAPVAARQAVDDWSSTMTTRPEASKPLPARHDADAVSHPVPVQLAAREPQTGKPILWIYYAAGAETAGENARALAARTRRDVSNVDFLTQTEVPKVAVIRYSEEKNRVLSSEMAKTLAALGYRWRIEDLSNLLSTPHNMIEVWLPTNQDGRGAP
jgi:hypothetical protein